VFYDPVDLDAEHVRLLGLQARLVTVPVRNSGHPSIGVVADTGLLRPILEQVLHGTLDLDWFYNEFRQRRGRSPAYLRQLSFRGKCQRRRLSILRRAIELAPSMADLRSHLGLLLSETGDFEGAEDAFRLAIDTEPRNPVHLYRRSMHLERSGRLDEAILAIEHLISIFGPASAYEARLNYLRSLKVQVLPKLCQSAEHPPFWRRMLARLLSGRPGQDQTR
jgi:tetratricopeptide (TPR) repeat protein